MTGTVKNSRTDSETARLRGLCPGLSSCVSSVYISPDAVDASKETRATLIDHRSMYNDTTCHADFKRKRAGITESRMAFGIGMAFVFGIVAAWREHEHEHDRCSGKLLV